MAKREEEDSRQALTWNPEGQRKRGRPKNTLRRMEIDMRKMNKNWMELEKKAQDRVDDMRKMNKNWMELEKKAQDRVGWRTLFGSLCSIGSNRHGNIYGAGATGINAGTGLILSQAGGLFGLGGAMIDGLLAGLLLALLLLISALIWACWRCKPGCCGWCTGKSSGLAGRSAWSRLAAICCAAPESAIIVKEKKHLLVSN
ncbi:unnamed protein product [Schistosoma mattheei]|uniref:Uncharacterized protein n=1 Tax=Schistosoma mattheei TaxID=31246 RepID=A0A183PTR7_9TREM|nr:unnamed protein product [Schistosoma mattheei]